MSLEVKLHPAERFLNWFPKHTKLYVRGERGADWPKRNKLDKELFDALVPFLEGLRHEARIEAYERVLATPFDRGETIRQAVEEMRDDEQRKSGAAKERMNASKKS
jgi:hypothetical protein